MALSWLESSEAFVALRDTASMEQLATTTNIEDKRWVAETTMTFENNKFFLSPCWSS